MQATDYPVFKYDSRSGHLYKVASHIRFEVNAITMANNMAEKEAANSPAYLRLSDDMDSLIKRLYQLRSQQHYAESTIVINNLSALRQQRSRLTQLVVVDPRDIGQADALYAVTYSDPTASSYFLVYGDQ